MTGTKPRPLANYRSDAKRSLQGRSPEFLKMYIGRQMIRIMVADELYEQQTGQSILAPTMRKALTLMRDIALGKN